MVFQNKLSLSACLIGLAAIFGSNRMFSHAECVKPSDLPVVLDGGEFLAAVIYESGNSNPINACNGYWSSKPAGTDNSLDCGYPFPYESLIVRPGCSFHLWEKSEYGESGGCQGGYYQRYDGPTVIPLMPQFESYKSRCGFDHEKCTPTDVYDVTLVCDATNAAEDVQCNYIKTIGTTFSEELSSSMSIDVTIEAHLSWEFWGIFSASMGVSTTTGYDWGHVSSQAMQVTETFEVQAVATAGTILTIEQVVGNCGGSQVNTEYFKISNTRLDGTTEVTYEKYLGNGQFVILE